MNKETRSISYNALAGFTGAGSISRSLDPSFNKWAVLFPGRPTEWFSDLLDAQDLLGKLRKGEAGTKGIAA